MSCENVPIVGSISNKVKDERVNYVGWKYRRQNIASYDDIAIPDFDEESRRFKAFNSRADQVLREAQLPLARHQSVRAAGTVQSFHFARERSGHD